MNTIFLKNDKELAAFLAYIEKAGIDIKEEKKGFFQKFLDGDKNYQGFPLRVAIDNNEVTIWDSGAKKGERDGFVDHGLEYLEEFCDQCNAIRWNDLKVGECFRWDKKGEEYLKVSEKCYGFFNEEIFGDTSINSKYIGIRNNHIVYPTKTKAKFIRV